MSRAWKYRSKGLSGTYSTPRSTAVAVRTTLFRIHALEPTPPRSTRRAQPARAHVRARKCVPKFMLTSYRPFLPRASSREFSTFVSTPEISPAIFSIRADPPFRIAAAKTDNFFLAWTKTERGRYLSASRNFHNFLMHLARSLETIEYLTTECENYCCVNIFGNSYLKVPVVIRLSLTLRIYDVKLFWVQ